MRFPGCKKLLGTQVGDSRRIPFPASNARVSEALTSFDSGNTAEHFDAEEVDMKPHSQEKNSAECKFYEPSESLARTDATLPISRRTMRESSPLLAVTLQVPIMQTPYFMSAKSDTLEDYTKLGLDSCSRIPCSIRIKNILGRAVINR